MSRSFKNTFVVKDRCPQAKKYANRKFRRTSFDEYKSGGAYKKHTDSYDISDWKFGFYSKSELKDWFDDPDIWSEKEIERRIKKFISK